MCLFIKKLRVFLAVLLISYIAGLAGCDLLDQQPKSQLTSSTFWKSENDVKLGLAGVYSYTGGTSWRGAGPLYLDALTDNGIRTKIQSRMALFSTELTPSDPTVGSYWDNSYQQIAKCNRFLEKVENFDMDENKKSEMIAEVRFLRAFVYYNLSQYWGSVPLVKKVLTMQEANSVSRVPKEEIVNFALSELTDAAKNLPWTRPANEFGRIVKSAALAVKGRLLLSQQKWNKAADTYKKIINSGAHSIDPDYKALFDGTKEESPEIIFSSRFVQDKLSNTLQRDARPAVDGGWHFFNPYQNLIDSYLTKEGKAIGESSLYDPDHPYENRDPRLYYNFYLPGYTKFAGVTYQGHPDSTSSGDEMGGENPLNTGYGVRKYVDEDYNGNIYTGGTDIPIIRYAEVLLSYLEAKIKGETSINQNLLDQTINKVRGRKSVDMPPVTETNVDKLWKILRHERRVEFPFEGIHYWDLLRWHKLDKVLNRTFYGMKLTDDPANYTGFPVGPKGHYKVFTMTFNKNKDYQWPIPQEEIDIDPNLEQYPEYK